MTVSGSKRRGSKIQATRFWVFGRLTARPTGQGMVSPAPQLSRIETLVVSLRGVAL